MNKEQKMVFDFHKEFKLHIGNKPEIPKEITMLLRTKLIREEFKELKLAIADNDIVEIADGLGDLLYVIYGCAISFGIDMEDIFAEIHASNMTKVGGHKREDGKWIKPDTYRKADLSGILKEQEGLS